MKLSVSKDALNESIQQVSKAISSRTTIPILGGIKIDATAATMTLTASDTDISIQSYISSSREDHEQFKLEQAGSIVLPAKFFVDIVRKLPEDQVEIQVNEHFHTTIRSGASEIQLAGMDPEEYPVLPGLSDHQTLTVHSDMIRSMVRQTIFSVSSNESTPILTGILWSYQDGKLKFTATDRHRLASKTSPVEGEQEVQLRNIVISGKNLNELQKLLPDHDTQLDIVFADNQVLFRLDTLLFYTRILDGVYPDTSKIIPQTYKTELVVNTKKFLNAMDRANLLSREEKTNIVRMATLEDGQLEISSSHSELGRITEQIPLEQFEGEPLKISFNSKYMLDVLKITESERLRIGFTGAMSPIILRPQDGQELLHLILPYRTTN